MLAVAIDEARGISALSVLGPEQQTIRAIFERQVGAAQQFDIGSGSTTPKLEATQPPKLDSVTSGQVAMEVVGQCPGDKRKIDQIACTPPASSAGDITGDELTGVEEVGVAPADCAVQVQAIDAATE